MANISDTPLISMVLVDDENNRTTFNGPIINDFTITEDLQSKITQLTTLATNISNLQTRLTNITNILNTQNIEFTDNINDVSSAGSKLYVQPQVYLKLARKSNYGNEVRYLNLTPYLTGKYNFPNFNSQLGFTCSLKINFDFNENEWLMTLGPNSIKDLSVGISNTIENLNTIAINGNLVYSNNAVIEKTITVSQIVQFTLDTVSGETNNIINISLFN